MVQGTGILGLPVKLAKSGFTPFLVTYALCFIMQVLVILFMTELMQRGKVLKKISGTEKDHKPTEDNALLEEASKKRSSLNEMPDLHTLGKMFLGRVMLVIFDFAVMLHFISILTSYVLAGSEAYGQLMGIPYIYIITPFAVIFTLVIVIAYRWLQPVISVLTFGKGSMLVLMVVVTAIVGLEVNNPITNDWRYIGKPFLIGTVALGGAINILPIIFAKIHMNRRDILLFLVAVIGGLFAVWILNVLWCYYILLIVPQTAPEGEVSLEEAGNLGEISTVPLIEIIEIDYPQFLWIAILVDIFIMLSITVSYITVGTATKHVVDGFIETWRRFGLLAQNQSKENKDNNEQKVQRRARCYNCWFSFWQKTGRSPQIIKQILLYLICFGTVYVIAITNPQAFIRIIENASSLALNLEAGAFICFMLVTARQKTANLFIPFVLHKAIYFLRWVVAAYFLFAVAYDLASIISQWTSFDYL